MRLQSIEISGFKSFAKKAELSFSAPVTGIVGPNGSGKSNVAEAFRFVLGEQSVKSLRGKKGEDLIFGGGKTLARQNRAFVKATFDNSDRKLPMDFDQISLERIVHRDGFNEYFINGTRVRLKDITELLAHANIGSSGHHIISQGEADRILAATPFERREMIEDALGLKIYHYRKKESVKKLEKTSENMKQVQSLRREIAPHINFLRKQVEKLEKARELKDKMATLAEEYFKRESTYISFNKKILAEEKKIPQQAIETLLRSLRDAEALMGNEVHAQYDTMLREAREGAQKSMGERDQLSRDLWKIEGELSAIARMQIVEAPRPGVPQSVAYAEVETFAKDIEALLLASEQEREMGAVIALLKQAKERIKQFFDSVRGAPVQATTPAFDTSNLERAKKDIEERLAYVSTKLQEAENRVEDVRRLIDASRSESREAERAAYEIRAKQTEASAHMAQIKLREQNLEQIEAEWKRDLAEVAAFVGHQVTNYEHHITRDEQGNVLSDERVATEQRSIQEDRKRALERMKIRLEDAGLGTGEEVLKEFRETTERDSFLQKELTDLETAAASLTALIADLDIELKRRFDDGIVKINTSFGSFFTTMFGGGEARLDIVEKKVAGTVDDEEGAAPILSEDEEEGKTVGIDVYVALPHKRIKGLVMLSGGERALTSIALLFALSQVNPPPFIILDETDAALDEANSRKYGDMIESLAQHSQLILITHNRETMSRASMLYGVTMASEGFSTLLSIKFDDAVRVAK